MCEWFIALYHRKSITIKTLLWLQLATVFKKNEALKLLSKLIIATNKTINIRLNDLIKNKLNVIIIIIYFFFIMALL